MQRCVSVLDAATEFGVPAGVALLDEISDATIGANRRRRLEPARERVHARDMRVKQIDWLEALAPALGVEVQSAGGESARGENLQHHLGGESRIGGEFVGVPAAVLRARVGIDRTKRARRATGGEFMLDGMTGERCVIGFDVQFEMSEQSELAQERKARRGVGVVLMHARLARLGLDVELPLEADRLLELNGHVQEMREMLALALHVGVEERGVALAAAPENISLAAEAVGDFDGLLHLRARVGKDLDARTGRGARHIARVCEQARGSPKQLLATRALQHLEVVNDLVEVRVRLGQRCAFGRNVAVMEAVEVDAALAKELEERVGASLAVVDGVSAIVPRHLRRRRAERIGKSIAHRVPVARGEAHLIAHRLAFDHLVGAIVAKAEQFLGSALNKWNGIDAGERFLIHGAKSSESRAVATRSARRCASRGREPMFVALQKQRRPAQGRTAFHCSGAARQLSVSVSRFMENESPESKQVLKRRVTLL